MAVAFSVGPPDIHWWITGSIPVSPIQQRPVPNTVQTILVQRQSAAVKVLQPVYKAELSHHRIILSAEG
jgi:hypothetical protein